MSPERPTQSTNGHPWIWMAGAVGTAAGLATLAYSRRDRGRWHNARRTMVRAADTVRSEARPWMGLAAAAVAGSATLVYTLSHRETRWQQARRQAGRMASRTGEQLRPWASVAAGALISLAAASRNRKAWEQTNGAKKMVQSATGQLAGTGLSLFRRVQRISGETKKLYPSVRKLIA